MTRDITDRRHGLGLPKPTNPKKKISAQKPQRQEKRRSEEKFAQNIAG